MNPQSTSCYVLENLQDLFNRSKNTHRTNYLLTTQNQRMTQTHRESIINWLYEISEDFHPQSKTLQLAICYIDLFLEKKTICTHQVLDLLTVIAFSLALKYEEGREIGLDFIVEFLEQKYQLDDVACMEVFVLSALNWNLDRPTAAEITSLLFSYTCDANNLQEFLLQVDQFAAICYIDYELSQENPFVLAVGSSFCMLQRFGIYEFRDAWLRKVQENFEIDMDSVWYCCEKVNSKIRSLSNNNQY